MKPSWPCRHGAAHIQSCDGLAERAYNGWAALCSADCMRCMLDHAVIMRSCSISVVAAKAAGTQGCRLHQCSMEYCWQELHRAGCVKAFHDIEQLLVCQRVAQVLEQTLDLSRTCTPAACGVRHLVAMCRRQHRMPRSNLESHNSACKTCGLLVATTELLHLVCRCPRCPLPEMPAGTPAACRPVACCPASASRGAPGSQVHVCRQVRACIAS